MLAAGEQQLAFRDQRAISRVRSGKCARCGRPLRDPVSVSIGLGPTCRGYRGVGSGGKDSMDSGKDLCKRDEFSDRYDGNTPFAEALILKRFKQEQINSFEHPTEVGGVITNVHHLVTHHSPDGFEFGYGGSGPADLALNICQLYLNMQDYTGEKTKCWDGSCWKLAYLLHQDFKRDIIASVPRSGVTIPFSVIKAWFDEHVTDELVKQCAVDLDGEE
jgi:hypothetical protein